MEKQNSSIDKHQQFNSKFLSNIIISSGIVVVVVVDEKQQ